MVGLISQAPSFRHLVARLKEIRLLVVQPGTDEEPVHCTIDYTSLKNDVCQDYEAVSYVWGTAIVPGFIFVDDIQVEIPSTSEEVLRNLRFTDRTRTLWIDAVCIHQADTEERNHQVALMGEVYGRTTCTVIWLGLSEHTTATAFGGIQQIYDDVCLRTSNCTKLRETLYGSTNTFQYDTSGLPSSIDFAAIRALFTRPWFTRIWVVQEAALSPTAIVYSGPFYTPLIVMLRAAVWMQFKQHHLPFNVEDEKGIMHASYMSAFGDKTQGWFSAAHGQRAALADLLRYFHDFDATVNRDKLYGLLGLTRWGGDANALPQGLVPKYQKPEEEVFSEATRVCIEETGDLWVLRYVNYDEVGGRTGERAPSWVPILFRKLDPEIHPQPLRSTFRANRGLRTENHVLLKTDEDPLKVLAVEGVEYDRLAVVGPTILSTTVGENPMVEFLIQMVLDRDICHATSNAFLDTTTTFELCLVLVGGSTFDPEPSHGVWESKHPESIFMTFVRSIDNIRASSEKDVGERHEAFRKLIHDAKFSRIFWAFRYALVNRRVFVTTRGTVGLGPRTTSVGDALCFLVHSRMPMILRQASRGFLVLGPCYVAGLMQGFGEEELTDIRIDTFFLK